MNKIEEFTSLLNNLDELDKKKFNSSEFQIVNNKLQKLLDEIASRKVELQKDNFFLDNKNTFLEIISKIESLQDKMIPKAEIINSFSKSQL
tara:strand:- start:1643 stop:1915 length:273 start_codon:yes stop_codon:yes gene_type:complete